jgi:hypothetical protein
MVVEASNWRHPLIRYLQDETLPEEQEEAARIKRIAAHYAMIGDKLYKRGFAAPMLPCVGELESQRILREIHDGSCGSHVGGRSLADKVIRA